MADVYEQNLPSKTTLTINDFIRVVGSDNVSYKQGISSVMTTMGIGKAVSYGDLASFYADFSAMAVDTKYFVSTWGNCSTALGLPSATYKGYATKSSATLCDMTVQTYGASGANVEYIGRVTFDNSGAVTATNWTKQPTRTEIDELNSKMQGSLAYKEITGSASTATVTITGSRASSIIFGTYDVVYFGRYTGVGFSNLSVMAGAATTDKYAEIVSGNTKQITLHGTDRLWWFMLPQTFSMS